MPKKHDGIQNGHGGIPARSCVTLVQHQKASTQNTLLYKDIPVWQHDNEYLLSGYRHTSGSLAHSFRSTLRWHNETINIHSHIIGCVLFAAAPWHFYQNVYLHYPNATITDLALFSLYLLGVSVCFACSACCHILWNHSHKVASFGNQLDYLGIILLMWGASLPSIHYGFLCDATLRNAHWFLVSLLASGCVYVTLHPRFRSPKFRAYRAYVYAGLGFAAILFVSHGLWRYGFVDLKRRMALDWMLLMAGFNLAGAAVYVSRVPERWLPYNFDHIGASHQIFHIMIVLAGLAHYIGLTRAFDEAQKGGLSC